MAKLIQSMMNAKLSRREFLKDSAATLMGIGALTSLAACSKEDEKPNDSDNDTEHSAITNPEVDGKWISAACWHNCGGRCMNKVMVKDGVVIRQKTDDTHEDSFDYPQQRGCVRGKAQQQQCFGADRIRYPMKRKNWTPENPNGHLRGKDEWERISWDDAFKYVGGEISRIKENYGNEAFLVVGWGSKYSCRLLNYVGGHTSNWDTTSMGTWVNQMPTLVGMPACGTGGGCDRFSMMEAEMVVFYSSNPAWSAPGTPPYNWLRLKEMGIPFVVVAPEYSSSAQAYDARWIPVRTGTDTAFLLGVAYEMVKLDEAEGNVIDWDFLNKYTVGFDADHMPADAKLNENFKDYLLGTYDKMPKSAEWASEIAGTPVEDIKWYAAQMTKQKKVAIMYNFACARNAGAENLPQLLYTVACMGGHYGKPGNCIGSNYHANCGNNGYALVTAGSTGLPSFGNPVEHNIPGPEVWQAVVTGKYHFMGDGWYTGIHKAEEKSVDIHCIFHDDSAYLQTGPNMKAGIEAHRKVDFVVSKAQFYTTNAKYSDIILPVTTQWEVPGWVTSSNREFVLVASKVTEPLFESKTDQQIDCGILEAMGIDTAEFCPISEEQQFFNSVAGCQIYDKATASYKPLVTITQADIDALGVEGTPQDGVIAYADFIANGGYQVQRTADDGLGSVAFADYLADPEANPLSSASGKFEIYCQAKADLYNSIGLDTIDYKPYPHYIVPVQGYETTFVNKDTKGTKTDYPYLLFNPHYLRRSHSVFDNCPWLREAWPNPVFISAADAKEKGIVTGDTVLVSTEYGKGLRKASVMHSLMPGHVGIPHGAWSDVDDDKEIDKGGSDNYLLGPVMSGVAVTGYNNYNCNIEKYSGEEIPNDCDKPQNIFEF